MSKAKYSWIGGIIGGIVGLLMAGILEEYVGKDWIPLMDLAAISVIVVEIATNRSKILVGVVVAIIGGGAIGIGIPIFSILIFSVFGYIIGNEKEIERQRLEGMKTKILDKIDEVTKKEG